MNYEGILEFKGTWRNYQARVLEHADRYMADGKIHIVAAPGSGKTTLGIELIRRMNGKALILAPSITIREQWIARIEEAFLCEGVQGEDFLSQNLKQPKAITVATYQALHSAMTRFQGMQEDAGEESGTGTDECLTENETEEVDYSGFDLVAAMKEAGIEADIVEDGKTFEENAIIKAKTIMELTGELVLADDSGLEIDYLNKEPGIYSARYMGEDTSYRVKNTNLIERLTGVPDEKRTARFVCAIAAAFPDGTIKTTEGVIEGRIGYEERGENGFGYDPIFYVPEFGCTTAELSEEQKNAVSHRGKALEKMREILKESVNAE